MKIKTQLLFNKKDRSHKPNSKLLKLSFLSSVFLILTAGLCTTPSFASSTESVNSETDIEAITNTPTFVPTDLANLELWNSIVINPAPTSADDQPSTTAADLAIVERTKKGITSSDPTISASSEKQTETPSETPNPTESATTSQTTNRWHFLIQPYLYLPISAYGDATVRGFRADFAKDASDIFSTAKDVFEFGILGRAEAWTPNYRWGFLLNGEYLAVGNNNSYTRPNPNRFLNLALDRIEQRIQGRVDAVLGSQIADYLRGRLDGRVRQELEARLGARLEDIIPSEFRSELDAEAWTVDLAVAYRFFNQSQVNPKGVNSEFDLGPLVVDLIGGMRIGGVNGDLEIDTNLGGGGDYSRSITLVKPLLGTRLRYNFSPYLAGVVGGTVAGFNISGLGLNWEALAGLDWKFSGNTSVGIGYRFAYLGYNSGSGNDEFDISLYSNGPYFTLTFRF